MKAQPLQPRRPFPEMPRDAYHRVGPVTERDAEGWLSETCFRAGPARQVGIELELLLAPRGPRGEYVSESQRLAFMSDLRAQPVRSRLTVEPGGQLELSTPPAPDVEAAVDLLTDDMRLIRRRAAGHGLELIGAGLDPFRAPRRVLDEPRYAAMEAYFDRTGEAGRLMMGATASVQVNVEAGGPADSPAVLARWRLLHAVGPALIAAFANSPLRQGRPSGWVSTRQAVWSAIDPPRTQPVLLGSGEALGEAWARWCLDAPLMLVRRGAGDPRGWTPPDGVRFRDWVRSGAAAVPGRPGPTLDDLAYHLTTLFPPVRARGHLEVRYLDAQPGDAWQVPVAVIAALVDDPAAGDIALAACAGTAERWRDAARLGVRDPSLQSAAGAVLAAAAQSLRARSGTAVLADRVQEHLDRYTVLGRSPGDDLLDTLAVLEATGGAR